MSMRSKMRTHRCSAAGKPGALRWPALTAALLVSVSAWAQTPARVPAAQSSLDAQIFYQLLFGELELARGEAGIAYQVLLDAARRTSDEGLFRHVVEIAVRARAGEQALAAAKAWRQAVPRSRGAAEVQAQLLLALGRPAEAVEPMRAAVEATPAGEREQLIATLPRALARVSQTAAGAAAIDKALEPWRADPATRTAATVATARAWALASEAPRALELLRAAQRQEPGDEHAALLALDLLGKDPGAEPALQTYLEARPDGQAVRLAYARRLTTDHRYERALQLVDEVTAGDAAAPTAWLMRGALLIQLSRPRDAQAALERFLAMKKAEAPLVDESQAAPDDAERPRPSEESEARRREIAQAYLMLAQAAEQQKDYGGAQGWLDQLAAVQGGPDVALRRASLLARQGRLQEARALVRALPESTPEELHAKVLGETQLLRDARAWEEADEVLQRALARLPDDADLIYERALVVERLKRFDDMERLLRRVIELQPSRQHAYNALGYSFVDRNTRLEEGRQLIMKALELAPGDPFITDSLAWAEFRLGRLDDALRLLREAYGKQPDTEIAAHLGEVLWTMGQTDEARRIWRTGVERDRDNEVLKETLTRMKVRL